MNNVINRINNSNNMINVINRIKNNNNINNVQDVYVNLAYSILKRDYSQHHAPID